MYSTSGSTSVDISNISTLCPEKVCWFSVHLQQMQRKIYLRYKTLLNIHAKKNGKYRNTPVEVTTKNAWPLCFLDTLYKENKTD